MTKEELKLLKAGDKITAVLTVDDPAIDSDNEIYCKGANSRGGVHVGIADIISFEQRQIMQGDEVRPNRAAAHALKNIKNTDLKGYVLAVDENVGFIKWTQGKDSWHGTSQLSDLIRLN